MPRPDTKTRILDAAEKLFAEHGVAGAGLRSITKKARVNVAAINYHFGTKENLVRAVLARFIVTLDRERDRRLEQARAKPVNSRERLEEIVRAFMMGWIAFRREHPEYVEILARMYSRRNRPNGFFRDMIQDGVYTAYTTFARNVLETLPDVPRDVLLMRINFAVITAASFLLNAPLVDGLKDLSGLPIDEELLVDHLVTMIESGLPVEEKAIRLRRKGRKDERTGAAHGKKGTH